MLSKHPNIFNEISRPLHHSVQSPHKHQNIIVRDSDIADIGTGPGAEEDILEYPIDLGDYQDNPQSFDDPLYYGDGTLFNSVFNTHILLFVDDYSGGSSYQYQAPPVEHYNVPAGPVDYAGRVVQGGHQQVNQGSGLTRGPLVNDLNQQSRPGNRPIRLNPSTFAECQ